MAHGVNVVPKIGICYLQSSSPVNQEESVRTYPEGSIIPDHRQAVTKISLHGLAVTYGSCRHNSCHEPAHTSPPLLVLTLTSSSSVPTNCKKSIDGWDGNYPLVSYLFTVDQRITAVG